MEIDLDFENSIKGLKFGDLFQKFAFCCTISLTLLILSILSFRFIPVASPHKDAQQTSSGPKPDRPPHAGGKVMGNQLRKDSFGSKDSLSSETATNNSSPITRSATGPVFSAHRKSLEQKIGGDDGKPPRKGAADQKNADVRKSVESLEDKKATPPPPVTKKPVVPIKKSPSITSVTNNLFSGLVKSKTKGQDAADGGAASKSQVADTETRGVVGREIAMQKAEEFDTVERSSMLVDPRAGRAKAPRRRPPSSSQSLSVESTQNGGSDLNGPESPKNHATGGEPELDKDMVCNVI